VCNGLRFRSTVQKKFRAKLEEAGAKKGYTAARQYPAERPADHAAIPVNTSGRL